MCFHSPRSNGANQPCPKALTLRNVRSLSSVQAGGLGCSITAAELLTAGATKNTEQLELSYISWVQSFWKQAENTLIKLNICLTHGPDVSLLDIWALKNKSRLVGTPSNGFSLYL